jgi:fructose-like PTS system EIIC or EIIBC or EIIABC component
MAIKKRSATVVPGASGAAAAVKNPQASKSSFWGELPQHVMSGISRMVPTLIMGGVILAFSQLIAYSWLKIPAEIGIMDALNSGKFSGFDLSLLKFAWLSQSFGGVLFGFAIPMFAAFVANSIGGKLAFPAGFIGGLMSTQPTQLLNFDPSTDPRPSNRTSFCRRSASSSRICRTSCSEEAIASASLNAFNSDKSIMPLP